MEQAAFPDLIGRKVAILSDHEVLFKAIGLSLNRYLGVEIVGLTMDPSGQPKNPKPDDDFDLIVVATSSPTSEPAVALATASLAKRIGQVPLLVISCRPFHSLARERVFHLEFPFEVEGLYDKVKEILR